MPAEPTSCAAAPAAAGPLGTRETAVVITAITALTVLAILGREIPKPLATLAAATCLLLVPACLITSPHVTPGPATA
ncbi:hypothetical protein ABTZ59_34565 [Streptomyces sp. NPDC094034]|uniref:hypothetical protein n=1 Tax=Streptomyces sp. NPDC094034 TaxID=3155309 RepID=UPI003331DCA6